MNVYTLFYDIPEASGLANPSTRLRRIGVRINLSCWLVREDEIPHHLLNELTEGGAIWWLIKQDVSEAPKLVAMALASMAKEAGDIVRRTEQSEARNAARLDLDHNHAGYASRVRVVLRRAQRRLAEIQAAAARFGIDSDSLGNALVAVNGLQAAAQERARQYAQMARQAEENGRANVAAAARADEIPALVLADVVEEAGGDSSSGRAAFDPDAATAPEPWTDTGDDEEDGVDLTAAYHSEAG